MTTLREELAKVPTGTMYIAAENWPKIRDLLKAGTPLITRTPKE